MAFGRGLKEQSTEGGRSPQALTRSCPPGPLVLSAFDGGKFGEENSLGVLQNIGGVLARVGLGYPDHHPIILKNF